MAKMSQEGDKIRQVTLNVNVGYAKSVLGILKVIEFLLLLMTWACMADCCTGSGALFGGRYGFYLFVTIFGWLCIICIYLWFLLTLSEKVKLPAAIADGIIVVLCFEILWAFLLLISASLVAEVANYFGTLKSFGGSVVGKVYDPMVAAVIFGFFTLVLFVVDIVILIIKIVKSRQSGQVAAAGNQQTA